MDAATSSAATGPSGELPDDELQQRIMEDLLAGRTLASFQGLGQEQLDAIYAVAHGFYESERYEDARQLFTHLMALDHHEPRYMGALASCLQMQGRYEEAIEYYCLASVYDLQDPRPTFHTAECLLALGRTGEARDALSMVVDDCREPRHEALKQRARALLDFIDGKAGKATERASS